MVGRRAAIKVYSIQVTGTFCRSYGWEEGCSKRIQHTGNKYSTGGMIVRKAAIKVYSLQVTGIFYRSYGSREGCSRRVQHTSNKIIRQYSA